MNNELGKIVISRPGQKEPLVAFQRGMQEAESGQGKPGSPEALLHEDTKPFFDVVTIDEAVRIVRSIAKQTGTETIIIDDAEGRVLAESIITNEDIPGFDRSWKDGYAVIAQETYAASESAPVILSLHGSVSMGKSEKGHISPGECMYIPTGGQMPDGADAVVMIEYAEQAGDKVIIRQPVVVRENVIAKDEVIEFFFRQAGASECGKLEWIFLASLDNNIMSQFKIHERKGQPRHKKHKKAPKIKYCLAKAVSQLIRHNKSQNSNRNQYGQNLIKIIPRHKIMIAPK